MYEGSPFHFAAGPPIDRFVAKYAVPRRGRQAGDLSVAPSSRVTTTVKSHPCFEESQT